VYINKIAIGFLFGLILLAFFAFALWVYALIDILINQKLKDPTSRILWFIFVFIFHFIGAIIYLILGKPKS